MFTRARVCTRNRRPRIKQVQEQMKTQDSSKTTTLVGQIHREHGGVDDGSSPPFLLNQIIEHNRKDPYHKFFTF